MLTALLSRVPGSCPSTLKTFQHGTSRSIHGRSRLPGRQWPVQVLFARQPAGPDFLAARTLSRCAHQFTRRHELPGVLHQDAPDVQIAARHADPRTTMRYDRARQNLDRHPNYILAAYMASGT
jgi:hypothetical protein